MIIFYDDDRDGFKDGLDPDCQVSAYCFDFQWGSEGTGNGQFIRTHDIGFDSAGFVYVLDRTQANVQKFTPNGQFISKFGSEGSGSGEFIEPYSMLIDPADNLYIVDKVNDRIQKLTLTGVPLDIYLGIEVPGEPLDDLAHLKIWL